MISTASTAVLDSETVLGKRKSPNSESFILRLVLESTSQSQPSKKPPPIIVNGSLIPHTNKRYKCTYSKCEKSYSKPSRLSEHERSHTGERPFACNTCNKSYLRETHLHAHARSHLPDSARPLVCPEVNCGKRFWTSQHLRVHEGWHNGLNTFTCPEDGCDAKFAKNHQLRVHISSVHSVQGTKPYRCEHEGCTKSFATNQRLQSHLKIHDDKRYTCVHVACLAGPENMPTYFPTWSALQHHIRIIHPPTCTHPSCHGRTFTSQKGLRAHHRLHEERELEEQMGDSVVMEDDMDGEETPRKRRRGGEIGRDWTCDVDGCDKDFKSKKALANHVSVNHLGRRDHVCPYESCRQAYGYKHLLQRHLAKVHAPVATDSSDSSSEDGGTTDSVYDMPPSRLNVKSKVSGRLDIDTLTGQSYAKRTNASVSSSKALRCPYPDLYTLVDTAVDELEGTRCQYAFSRAYDFRRHLKATHDIDVSKERADEWVNNRKKAISVHG